MAIIKTADIITHLTNGTGIIQYDNISAKVVLVETPSPDRSFPEGGGWFSTIGTIRFDTFLKLSSDKIIARTKAPAHYPDYCKEYFTIIGTDTQKAAKAARTKARRLARKAAAQ